MRDYVGDALSTKTTFLTSLKYNFHRLLFVIFETIQTQFHDKLQLRMTSVEVCLILKFRYS